MLFNWTSVSLIFIKLVNNSWGIRLHILFFSHLDWITSNKIVLSEMTQLIVRGLSLTCALIMDFNISTARCQVMRLLVQVVQMCDWYLVAAANVRWNNLPNLVCFSSLILQVFVTIIYIHLMRWKRGTIVGMVVMPISVVVHSL